MLGMYRPFMSLHQPCKHQYRLCDATAMFSNNLTIYLLITPDEASRFIQFAQSEMSSSQHLYDRDVNYDTELD